MALNVVKDHKSEALRATVLYLALCTGAGGPEPEF